jgi:hypothetical protein
LTSFAMGSGMRYLAWKNICTAAIGTPANVGQHGLQPGMPAPALPSNIYICIATRPLILTAVQTICASAM